MAVVAPTPMVEGAVVSSGSGGAGLVELAKIIGGQQELHIRQHVPRFAACEGDCCEIKNKYYISMGNDGKGQVLLEAHENGKCIDRVCCKPTHSRALHVVPAGGTKEQAMLTIDHPGAECICCGPKPCIGGFVLMDCCADGINIYDGYVEGQAGHLEGNLISAIKQPIGGGGCTPTLEVDGKAYVEGPMCFGGWSECCIESEFTYSTAKGKTGDIAKFKHLRPKDLGGACREACTDSDNFGVTFAAGATAEMKADALSAAILVDYMFFERDQGLCNVEDQVLYCTCFLCYCFGCLRPCNLCIPLKSGGGGAPPSAENMAGAPPAVDQIPASDEVAAVPPMDRSV